MTNKKYSNISNWQREIVPEDIRNACLLNDKAKLLKKKPKWMLMHDLGLMKDKYMSLKNAFPFNTLHAIAIKANPLVGVLKELVKYGAGLEAASIEEVHIALRAGCPPERIVFDSPAKTREEINESLRIGIILNADNPDELARINDSIELPSSSSIIGLRINPLVGDGKIQMTSVSGEWSKFGIPISKESKIIELFKKYSWLKGLHIHTGSQGYDVDTLAQAIEIQYRLAERINKAVGHKQITVLDIGGGLPARYKDDIIIPEPSELSLQIKNQCPGLFNGDYKIITEYGRSLLAACAFAISQAEYIKDINGQQCATVHYGADFLMRAIYQPEYWSHRILHLTPDYLEAPLKNSQNRAILGPLCFNGDVLTRKLKTGILSEGDWLAVRDVGAYTLSMWSRHCSRALPPVIGYNLETQQVKLLFRGETPEDVADFWDIN